jgi:hypothetical protein
MSYGGENNLPRCTKCHLRTLERHGDDAHCTECGSDFPGAFSDYDGKELKLTVANTKKRKKRDRRGNNYEHLLTVQKHRYIEENKDAIIADLFNIGRIAVRVKWDIGNTSLYAFEKKWLTEGQRDRLTSIGNILRQAPRSHNGQPILPAFPAFSNQWDPETQLKWLEIYEKLFDVYSSENMKGGNLNGNPVAGSSK